jgi:hypothetical protein
MTLAQGTFPPTIDANISKNSDKLCNEINRFYSLILWGNMFHKHTRCVSLFSTSASH